MQLAELLKDWPCSLEGSIRVEVNGIAENAEAVQQGDLFVARKGRHIDGKQYIAHAINKGASVIVVDDEQFFQSEQLSVPFVWVPNCQQFLAYAAHILNGCPSYALQVIAVTGTNGKTTVSHWIGQLLQQFSQKVLVIGTNGVYVNGEKQFVDVQSLTTLSAIELQKLLKQAVEWHVDTVVLEASSMGLANYRLDYCDIDVGVFLNLSAEHIEDHGSMDQYKLAKQRLMSLCKFAVFNGDDLFCRSLSIICKLPKLLFGSGQKVDVQIQTLTETMTGSTCCIQYKSDQQAIWMPFIGDYQRLNGVAAVTVLLALQYAFPAICEKIEVLQLPKGRMETYVTSDGMKVVIDYAHTPAALKAVLQTLRKQCVGQLTCIFSCGGERDRAKRKEMGTIASKYCEKIVLTTDNCRSENPKQINAEIATGFFVGQLYEEILDRKHAIEQTILQADSKDIVVVVGKGHEQTQIIGNRISPHSDELVVKMLLSLRNDEKRSRGSS